MALGYSVERAAAELLLDPLELQEVYEVFFTDGLERLDECRQGLVEMDLLRVKRVLHGIRGVAASLQMGELTELLAAMEAGIGALDREPLVERLAGIVSEFHRLEAEVGRYYGQRSG